MYQFSSSFGLPKKWKAIPFALRVLMRLGHNFIDLPGYFY